MQLPKQFNSWGSLNAGLSFRDVVHNTSLIHGQINVFKACLLLGMGNLT